MGLFGSSNKLVETEEQRRQREAFEVQFPQAGHWTPDMAPQMPQQGQQIPQQRPPGFWGGGGKFTARDGIAGLLAAVGDAFAQRGGGQGGAVSMLAGGRMDALDMARKAQAAQSERAAALEDYGAKKRIDQQYQAPATPYRFEDNAGNVWERDAATGENRRIFTDEIPKMYVQGDQAVQIGNPYAQHQPQGGQLPPVGSVMADPRRGGGTGNGVGGFQRR
jgi:hypothetical protein